MSLFTTENVVKSIIGLSAIVAFGWNSRDKLLEVGASISLDCVKESMLRRHLSCFTITGVLSTVRAKSLAFFLGKKHAVIIDQIGRHGLSKLFIGVVVTVIVWR